MAGCRGGRRGAPAGNRRHPNRIPVPVRAGRCAAAWRTDFDFTTEHGLDVLPEHLLVEYADVRALPHRARRNVANVIRLAGTSPRRYALNLWLWRRVMRTRPARDEVPAMLDALFAPKRSNAAARRRMLGYLLRP